MDGDFIDPLHEVPWVRSVLDQDEFYADTAGRRWTMDLIPADTAQDILDELRGHSIHLLHSYTDHLVAAVDSARRFGYTIPLEWAPDSVPYLDQFTWIQLEGATSRHDKERLTALAHQWLETKPMVKALQRRAYGLA